MTEFHSDDVEARARLAEGGTGPHRVFFGWFDGDLIVAFDRADGIAVGGAVILSDDEAAMLGWLRSLDAGGERLLVGIDDEILKDPTASRAPAGAASPDRARPGLFPSVAAAARRLALWAALTALAGFALVGAAVVAARLFAALLDALAG